MDKGVELACAVNCVEQSTELAEGVVVGAINVKLGDELVARRDLVTLGSVEEAGFFGSMWDGMRLWVDGLFEDDEAESEAGSE